MSPLYRAPKNRTAIKPQGQRASRRAPFYAASKRKLLIRIRQGGYACELCGRKGGDLDTHHIWGRAGTGARLGWPWCDMPENLAGICRDCHTAVTDGKKSDHPLRRDSYGRFLARGLVDGWLTTPRAQFRQIAVEHMRELVDEAEANGGRDTVLGITEAA